MMYDVTIKKKRTCNLYNYDFKKQSNERDLLLLFTEGSKENKP